MLNGKTPNWAEITAVFGGTFDPPHTGHVEAVRGLFEDPGVQRVLVLPTSTPPHKHFLTSAEHRVAMVKLCFASSVHQNIQIDLTEIERSMQRPGGYNYSFDTLQELSQRFHGSNQLAFVIGADQLASIENWFRFPEVLDLCHWIVLARKPSGLATALQAIQKLEASNLLKKRGDGPTGSSQLWHIGKMSSFLRIVDTRAPEISSTDVRQALCRNGSAPEGSLVPAVEAYLKLHHLYGT